MADFAVITPFDTVVDLTYSVIATQFTDGGSVTPSALGGAVASGLFGAVGSGHPPAPGRVNFPALRGLWNSPGVDWFGRVHILPRSPIAVGVILSQVTRTFEVFNAHRETVQFSAFTNNVGVGVSVPDLPAQPSPLEPFVSFVDPTGTGLVPLPMQVLIARDGVPLFDGTLDFSFSSGDTVFLRLSGSRISLIPLVYESRFTERWAFPSDVLESLTGAEQVISLASNPVQAFSVRFLLDGNDRQRLQMILFGAQSQILALPLWHEDIFTTAAVGLGATAATVSATANSDFRVGGLAVLFTSAEKYDVVALSAVGATSLTFATTPTLNAYAAGGVRVAPVRLGYITNDVDAQRFITTVESFRVVFEVIENDTGMFAGSTAGWTMHAGAVVLDECNVVDSGGVATKLAKRITLIDNGTGRITVLTDWPTNRRESTQGFAMRNRAAYRRVKQLLLALRGPQKSFFLPTWAEDLTPAASLVATATTFDVVNIGYTKHGQARAPKATFKITFTDQTSLVRTVLSSVEVSASVERLTIDAAWPANRNVAEIVRAEFLELSRANVESFSFEHLGSGRVTLDMPAKTLL